MIQFLKKLAFFFTGILLVTFIMDYLYYGGLDEAIPDSAFYFVKILLAAILVTFLSTFFKSRKSA